MPIREFTCTRGHITERLLPLNDARKTIACRKCHQPGRRARLSLSLTSARRSYALDPHGNFNEKQVIAETYKELAKLERAPRPKDPEQRRKADLSLVHDKR